MKKAVAVIICLILCGCSANPKVKTNNKTDNFISGVWISHSELDNMLISDNFKASFTNAVKNIKQNGITDVFVQVRPFCDSIYKSDYFPIRSSASGYDFDVMSFMVDKCHENKIKFHAWINPYRVKTTDSDISTVNSESPVYKWLNDGNSENDKNVILFNGIYLNPASSEVIKLISDGVREIINNYDIDGIHIDDYFYPTTSPDFDLSSYNEYLSESENPLSLNEYRTSNINSLISSLYTAIKFKSKDLIFSISPSASINKNLNTYYADIKAWCENDCVDMIIPQLYFGFEYPIEEFRFDKLLNDYLELDIHNTKLLIGLATYKIKTTAEPDAVEWADGEKIITKQIDICKKENKVSGIVFFSYSSFLSFVNN